MIRYAIVICINLLAGANVIQSQSSTLLDLEERWFYASTADEKQKWMLQKLEFQLQNPSSLAGIYSTMERIDAGLIADSALRANFLWNAALFCLLDEREQEGMTYLNKYQKFSNDSTSNAKLLKIVLRFPYHPTEADSMYDALLAADSSYAGLDCFFDVSLYTGKGLNYYILASALLPGSGIIAQGKPVKGLTSMGLNAGSIVLGVLLWREQLYINSILWGGMLFSKFYPGQLLLTESVFEQRILRKKEKHANECELLCAGVLNRLQFRELITVVQ
jgi:hypothetical protein